MCNNLYASYGKLNDQTFRKQVKRMLSILSYRTSQIKLGLIAGHGGTLLSCVDFNKLYWLPIRPGQSPNNRGRVLWIYLISLAQLWGITPYSVFLYAWLLPSCTSQVLATWVSFRLFLLEQSVLRGHDTWACSPGPSCLMVTSCSLHLSASFFSPSSLWSLHVTPPSPSLVTETPPTSILPSN